MIRHIVHHDPPTVEDLQRVASTPTVHHRPASRKRPVERGVRPFNLTAMLDVTFLLLVFFLTTANFAANEGILAADLPVGRAPTTAVKPPQQPLVIELRRTGIDDVAITLERGRTLTNNDFPRLYDILNGMRYDPQANPNGIYDADNPIIIRPDADVAWQHVVDAFNAVTRARFTNVNFAQARPR